MARYSRALEAISKHESPLINQLLRVHERRQVIAKRRCARDLRRLEPLGEVVGTGVVGVGPARRRRSLSCEKKAKVSHRHAPGLQQVRFGSAASGLRQRVSSGFAEFAV